MRIQAFFAPDTPALRLASRRAGVFCASGNRIHPRHHRRITRRIGNAALLPTFPNRAGNPASTSITIQTFFAPDTPALQLAGRRAGVFCASGNRIHPRHHRRITRRIGNAWPPQHSQTRRVIRRLPPSASQPLCAGHTRPTVGLPITNIAQQTHADLSPGEEIARSVIHRLMRGYGNLYSSIFA
jgi:hypothetical protein